MKNSIFFLLLFCLDFLLSPDVIAQKKTTIFQEVTEIPDGKAVVYFYRFNSFNTFTKFAINDGNKPVSPILLATKGYIVYFAEPGKKEFWAQIGKAKSQIEIYIEAGKSYFVSGRVTPGQAKVGKPLLLEVSNEEALKEIKKCKLLVEE
ncbi:MAG: hypothetical protein JW702_01950 [Clostridiales bacterium]|nr:hypothetical protein [Clostridiales bacterium]